MQNAFEDEWNGPIALDTIFNTIDQFKGEDDLRSFIGLSEIGKVYDDTGAKLQIPRKSAKGLIIRTLFSEEEQRERDRKKLEPLFPTVVQLANKLNNDEAKTIPQLLQRLEASIVVDRIIPEIIYQQLGPVLTIHDSFIVKKSVVPNVSGLIVKVFEDLGLPSPMIKQKRSLVVDFINNK